MKTAECLAPEQLAALRAVDACTLANAIESCNERLRNEGYTDSSIRCLMPHLSPMVGHAATVTIRGSAPPTAAEPYTDRTDWWDYVLSLPAPRVVVIHDAATRPGSGALVGAVHMNILRALGCVGVVTDGAVRDVPAATRSSFHYFAGSLSVSHSYVHIVDFGSPVEVGRLTVKSGDLLHGDVHGVQSVPVGRIQQILDAATAIAARKQELIALMSARDFSVEKLRAAVARDGLLDQG
jgi:regulator of RNase E activity RraA